MYYAWMLDRLFCSTYLLLNITPHTMLDTAFGISVWQLNGLLLCLLNSAVSTSTSSAHFSSIDDFPTPKSRIAVMANFLLACQSVRLKTMPFFWVIIFMRCIQSGRSLKMPAFSTRASFIRSGLLSTTAGWWPRRNRKISPNLRLQTKFE